MTTLAADISKFDMTLFGIVDLSRKPMDGSFLNPFNATYYIPGLIIVVLSAIVQFLSSKQLMMVDKDARSLRKILKDASSGIEADQAEVNAATMRNMQYLIPVLILVTSIHFAAALGLYWFVSGLVQYLQQRHILGKDQDELMAIATVDDKTIEAEVIPAKSKPAKKSPKSSKKKKRR
jgi:YidC/Oxa1 family membrane protein insertase